MGSAPGKVIAGFDAKALHTYERRPAGRLRRRARSGDLSRIGTRSRPAACTRRRTRWGPSTSRSCWSLTRRLASFRRTLLTDGITGGVIWRLRYLADGSLMGACGGSNGGFLLFWKTGHRQGLPPLRPAQHPSRHGPSPRRPARRNRASRRQRQNHPPGGWRELKLCAVAPLIHQWSRLSNWLALWLIQSVRIGFP